MASVTVTTKLARIQTEPNASDNPTATAYFSKATEVDGVVFNAPWESINWELKSSKTVMLDGVEYPYYLVSQLVTAIADQEYASQQAPSA